MACMKEEGRCNMGSPARWVGRPNGRPVTAKAWPCRMADGLVVPMKLGNAGGGKEPWFETDV